MPESPDLDGKLAEEVEELRVRVGGGDAVELGPFFERMLSTMRREAHFARLRANSETHGTTDIVDECVLRMMSGSALNWNDEAHFRRSFKVTAWNFLVSEARARAALKRGGEAHHTSLDQDQHANSAAAGAEETQLLELVSLESALDGLRNADADAYAVFVEHHVADRTFPETAEALGMDDGTRVKKKWSAAKWFLAEWLLDAESRGDEEVD